MPPNTRNKGAKPPTKAEQKKAALLRQQEEAAANLLAKQTASKKIKKDKTVKKEPIFKVVKENTQQAVIASVSIIRNAFVLHQMTNMYS